MLNPHPHFPTLDSTVTPPVLVRIGVQNEKFTDVTQRVEFSGCARVTADHSWRGRLRKADFATVAGYASDQEFHLTIENANGSRETHRVKGGLGATRIDADCVWVSLPQRNDWLIFDDALFTTREAWLRFYSLVIQSP